jgi:hypothetical protein
VRSLICIVGLHARTDISMTAQQPKRYPYMRQTRTSESWDPYDWAAGLEFVC